MNKRQRAIQELDFALAQSSVRLGAEGLRVHRPGPFADLEALREAALPVGRFAPFHGAPGRTYRRRVGQAARGRRAGQGPWPTPAVDAAEDTGAEDPLRLASMGAPQNRGDCS